MTPEQLKTSILYSALKGQLTEQFIGKEDAKRDYPNIKVSTAEDIPYDLPDNWLWVDLKEVATNQNGYAFKPSDWLQSGTKIIRIQNLTDADVPCNYCDGSIVEDKYKIKDGDVLVSWSCTIDAFLYEGEDAVLNQHIFKIIFDKISIDKRFYIYAIKSLLSTINNRRHGSTMTHITKKDFESLYFPLPPLEEQHRIVAKIEELLPYVDRYAEAYEKLEQFNAKFPEDMKKSILQYAIQGKLVEQRPEEGTAEELYQQIQDELKRLEKGKLFKVKDDSPIEEEEIPFDIPFTWKWLRLGQVLNIESGKGLTAKQMKKGNIPVYGGNGITGYHDEALIHKETVVIGRVGFYCGSVHVTPSEAWVTDNAFITTYPEKSIYRDYLVYVLRFLNLGQNSNATAQPVVSGKKIYPMLFPLPPLEEQKRIAARIEEILPICERLVK